MPDIFIPEWSRAWLSIAGEYKPGDMPPKGYNDWHEWAKVQQKAGLRQARCPACGKWRYPQELKVCCKAKEA